MELFAIFFASMFSAYLFLVRPLLARAGYVR